MSKIVLNNNQLINPETNFYKNLLINRLTN